MIEREPDVKAHREPDLSAIRGTVVMGELLF